jgi:hypothetical protein
LIGGLNKGQSETTIRSSIWNRTTIPEPAAQLRHGVLGFIELNAVIESPGSRRAAARRHSARCPIFAPVIDSGWACSQPVEHDAGKAAFEGAQCAMAAVALGEPPLEVGSARSVVDGLCDGDAVEGGVEPPVALAGRA